MREGLPSQTRAGRLAGLFRALLVLDLAWCLASLMLPGLPGWKMFAGGAAPSFSVTDASGTKVDLRPFVPSHATLQDARTVVEVARFACRRDRLLAPATVVFGDRTVVISPGCSAAW